jgi:Mlc titration factor MtfA (ptsG expression regulator)
MQIVRSSDLLFRLLIGALVGLCVGVLAGRVGGAAVGWALGLGSLALVLTLGMRRAVRRWRVARQTLAPEQVRWIEEHVPFYASLEETGRARFRRDVRFFLAERRFERADDRPLDPELPLAIAAGAALLLHGRPDWELPDRRAILFLPDRFDDDYASGTLAQDADYDGMVHAQGPVVFSERAVRLAWQPSRDGYNVVLHELAHLFDFQGTADGDADGVPSLLGSGEDAWLALAKREMRLAERGRSVLPRYAATNHAELFAVGTEQFFERPDRLAARHPELFAAFEQMYGLDPRTGADEGARSKPASSLMSRRWR